MGLQTQAVSWIWPLGYSLLTLQDDDFSAQCVSKKLWLTLMMVSEWQLHLINWCHRLLFASCFHYFLSYKRKMGFFLSKVNNEKVLWWRKHFSRLRSASDFCWVVSLSVVGAVWPRILNDTVRNGGKMEKREKEESFFFESFNSDTVWFLGFVSIVDVWDIRTSAVLALAAWCCSLVTLQKSQQPPVAGPGSALWPARVCRCQQDPRSSSRLPGPCVVI